MRTRGCVVALCLMPVCRMAVAATLFEQLPGIDSSNLTISSTLNNLGGTPGFQIADNFQLAAGGTVNVVEWWGRLRSGGASFQITFFLNAGGRPGVSLSTIAVTPTSSSANTGSPFDPVTFYSATLSDAFNAAPGTTYWMSVFDAAPDARWLWLAANNDTIGASRAQNGTTAWTSTDDVGFRLSGSVPEPATFSLVAIAILALARRSRWVK